jgi:hypothetical protein
MNNIIKELEARCVVQIDNADGTTDFDLDREKFASLIVEACAQLCADVDGGENMFSRAIRGQFGE